MNMEEYLEQCRNVDPCTVDRRTLRDLADVHINEKLSDEERFASFIEQIGNPYCYKSCGLVVKVSFAGECSLEEAVAHYITLRHEGGLWGDAA